MAKQPADIHGSSSVCHWLMDIQSTCGYQPSWHKMSMLQYGDLSQGDHCISGACSRPSQDFHFPARLEHCTIAWHLLHWQGHFQYSCICVVPLVEPYVPFWWDVFEYGMACLCCGPRDLLIHPITISSFFSFSTKSYHGLPNKIGLVTTVIWKLSINNFCLLNFFF